MSTVTPDSMSAVNSLVGAAMTALARRRPLFHSEADFQLALAWELQTAHSQAQLRLEQRVMRDPPVALDILMRLDDRRYAFELKYLKRRLEIVVDGEPYKLATGAPDVEHYDILKDISRLERLTSSDIADAGCALVLTNVDDFWKPRGAGARTTGFDQFRLNDGRKVEGQLEWGPLGRNRHTSWARVADQPSWHLHHPLATLRQPRLRAGS